MAQTIGFRDAKIARKVEQIRDEAEEESGYRPSKSEVVRKALREHFGIEDESAEAAEVGA